MIRRFIFFAGLIILGILVQTTLFTHLDLLGTRPDLALVLLMYLALYQGATAGQFAGFISGLTEDVLSIVPLGFFSLINTIIGFLLGLFKDKIDVNSAVFPLVLIPVITVFKYLVIMLLSVLFSVYVDFSSIFSLKTILEIGFNLVFGLLLFMIFFFFRLKNGDRVSSHVVG